MRRADTTTRDYWTISVCTQTNQWDYRDGEKNTHIYSSHLRRKPKWQHEPKVRNPIGPRLSPVVMRASQAGDSISLADPKRNEKRKSSIMKSLHCYEYYKNKSNLWTLHTWCMMPQIQDSHSSVVAYLSPEGKPGNQVTKGLLENPSLLLRKCYPLHIITGLVVLACSWDSGWCCCDLLPGTIGMLLVEKITLTRTRIGLSEWCWCAEESGRIEQFYCLEYFCSADLSPLMYV